MSAGEQLDIRRDAISGAIHDQRVSDPDNPGWEDDSPEAEARVNAKVERIMQELGVSVEEAELILAEEIILELKSLEG